jgi:sugar/nucleoside kinase (ribokinase family)
VEPLPSSPGSPAERHPVRPPPDLLVVGEVLADLIADEHGAAIRTSRTFRRVLGGSAANLAVTFSRLGGAVTLVGSVGGGPTGRFLIDELAGHGLDPRHVRRVTGPTTLVFIDRGAATPEFEIVRGVDHWIRPDDIPAAALASVGVLHTSAFALSREPARATILTAIDVVRARGGRISLDLNYEPTVWGGRRGQRVLADVVGKADFVKASLDDASRLFDGALEPDRAAARLEAWGTSTVVVTMGRDGAWFRSGSASGHVAADLAVTVDTTGAGDAFWAGVLRGVLLGQSIRESVVFGNHVAARKLAGVGPLSEDLDATSALGTVAGKSSISASGDASRR